VVKHQPIRRVIFLLNITKVGENAFYYAVNLIVVDIPEGIKSIGRWAFRGCSSLTTVSFPTTLTGIGRAALAYCSILDTVDLLHTNLQELGRDAFAGCLDLKLMTIPDSLQTLGEDVFLRHLNLAPSNIDVRELDSDGEETTDATSNVVAHLRLQQLLAGNNFLNTDDFRRLVVPFLQNNTLMTIRQASKPWSRVADAFIDDGVASGAMIVHDGDDIGLTSYLVRKKRRELVTRAIFLLNVIMVGERACTLAVNLIVVDIPEVVESMRASVNMPSIAAVV